MMGKKYITLLDCKGCGIKIRDSREKYVVTLFFDYEPSKVYGSFASYDEGLKWAISQEGKCHGYTVQLIREVE
jgi:hypothetical protein